MSNKHCKFLSNGNRLNIQHGRLMWAPCCHYTKKVDMESTIEFHKAKNYTSGVTGWIPECAVCQRIEEADSTALSPRKSSFIRIPDDHPNETCVDLEINIDTKCNAACIMCDGNFSSTWRKFDKKHGLRQYLKDVDTVDVYLDRALKLIPLDNIRQVFFQGGEPFFSDTHQKIVEKIYQVHQNPGGVSLNYITNGSIFPDGSVLELWNKFGSVAVAFSIDGVGDRFEYIRWPLKWDQVNEVIQRFINETTAMLDVSHTINPLNLLYWDEVANWVDATFPVTRLRDSDFRKKTIKRSYGGATDFSLIDSSYVNFAIDQYGDTHRMTSMLRSVHYANDVKKIVSWLDKLDSIRGISWRKVFPEAVKFLDPPVV